MTQNSDKPVAWTGSGSLRAIEAGREGHIWPEPADAHPVPLYASPTNAGQSELATADKLARRMGGRFVPHEQAGQSEDVVERIMPILNAIAASGTIERMDIANLQAALDLPAVQREARREGYEQAKQDAARLVEKRRDERFAEHGTREPDTNACYYSGRSGELFEALDEEDEEIADAIRALKEGTGDE